VAEVHEVRVDVNVALGSNEELTALEGVGEEVSLLDALLEPLGLSCALAEAVNDALGEAE